MKRVLRLSNFTIYKGREKKKIQKKQFIFFSLKQINARITTFVISHFYECIHESNNETTTFVSS